MSEYTHIIKIFPTDEGEELFRADTKMRIAACKKGLVVYGEDPNKAVGRHFMNHEAAAQFLRNFVAVQDLKDRGIDTPPNIKVENAEHLVIQPGTAFAMPGDSPRAFTPGKVKAK